MEIENVMFIMREALLTIIKTVLPLLLVSLCVGLSVSIFQTVTSIQEQTLTFVPKVLAVFLTLTLIGNWMLNNVITFVNELWSGFAVYIR